MFLIQDMLTIVNYGMEAGPRFEVSSDRLEKLGIETGTRGLQGEWFIHYITALKISVARIFSKVCISLPDCKHSNHVLFQETKQRPPKLAAR